MFFVCFLHHSFVSWESVAWRISSYCLVSIIFDLFFIFTLVDILIIWISDFFYLLFFQIGLDGIRMLDPSTSRTLRIYPLENITRCEVSLYISFIKISILVEFLFLGKISFHVILFIEWYRDTIHLLWHFGPRAQWTSSQNESDCNPIVTLPTHFWILWLLQLYR